MSLSSQYFEKTLQRYEKNLTFANVEGRNVRNRGNKVRNLMRRGKMDGEMRGKIKNISGSEEPMFGYDPNAINKERMRRTCMTCRGTEEEKYNTRD